MLKHFQSCELSFSASSVNGTEGSVALCQVIKVEDLA